MKGRLSLFSHAVGGTTTLQESLGHSFIAPGSSKMQRGFALARPRALVGRRELQQPLHLDMHTNNAVMGRATVLAIAYATWELYYSIISCPTIILYLYLVLYYLNITAKSTSVILKKKTSASKSYEHPPLGEKLSKYLGGNIGCRD